jgi:hypothetical protein
MGETEYMKKLTNPHDFVGKFFFGFKDDELQWQGQIISRVSEGVFLVQLHEWDDRRNERLVSCLSAGHDELEVL